MIPMPVADVSSNGVTWTPIVKEDFSVAAGLGKFRTTYANDLSCYPDGSGDGKYQVGDTVTATQSMMQVHLHTKNGQAEGAACQVINPTTNTTTFTGGRFSVEFRADSVAGYGAAFMLFPANNVWSEGEIDFPEGPFDGSFNLFQHQRGAHPEVNLLAQTNLGTWGSWHVATVDWKPGASMHYYLDGKLVGQVTTPSQVPTTPHSWTIQTGATASDGTAPAASSGNLQIAWVVAYAAKN